MRTIIRCPSCFTYVYQDARACHGCGERLGKRKILRRGSWIFIGLAVSAFTIARGIDLEQEKSSRFHREAESQLKAETTLVFLNGWLLGDQEAVANHIGDRGEPFQRDLAKLRDRYPNVLPADNIVGQIRVTPDSGHSHYQADKGKDGISHANWGQPDKAACNRASCVPRNTSPDWVRRTVNGVKVRSGTWYLQSFEFEAEFTKAGAHYTIYGEVCVDDKVCCLTVDKIVGIEGVVSPKE